jgi:hypothetical protein
MTKAERATYGKAWREANRERLNTYDKAWRRQNPARQLLQNARERARKQGLPFDLVVEDVVIPETCPVLGIPLFISGGTLTANSPTIDRVVPELGYVRGNVAVISWRANSLKKDGTVEELKAVVDWMEATLCGGPRGEL